MVTAEHSDAMTLEATAVAEQWARIRARELVGRASCLAKQLQLAASGGERLDAKP
jgi:hypothetical protein